MPHGFRATFRTWADQDRNAVSGAYRRSDLFDRRIGLMDAWAAHYCSTAAAVKPIRAR